MTETTTEPTTSDEIRMRCNQSYTHFLNGIDMLNAAIMCAESLPEHDFNRQPLERVHRVMRECKAHFLGAMSELASVATNAEGKVSDGNAN